MQEVITYSLRGNENNSDQYYKEIAVFTDEVLAESRHLIFPLVENYSFYVQTKKAEDLCSIDEYILEVLTLGVLWQVYSGDALDLQEIPQQLLAGLSELRQQGGYLKPGIDFVRGILSTLFLSPDLYDHISSEDLTLINLKRLLDWLEATGDFCQEVIRLQAWYNYLTTLSPGEISFHLASAITLAVWFEGRSEAVLGQYTCNVDRFLNEIRPKHYWCEDVIFCGRRRVEYHLNMVGAEIMNRAFRSDFLKTKAKALILPSCMRTHTNEICQASATSLGLSCTGCTPGCRVNQLTRLGKGHCFHVFVLAHESSFKNENKSNEELGIIGVACILNLMAGGWKAKNMGLPPQCVLLDYCGCKNHWHKEGFPTDINIEQLMRILQI